MKGVVIHHTLNHALCSQGTPPTLNHSRFLAVCSVVPKQNYLNLLFPRVHHVSETLRQSLKNACTVLSSSPSVHLIF